MKLESANITLNVKEDNKVPHWKGYFPIARKHLEELRDLINDYLEMEKKGKL